MNTIISNEAKAAFAKVSRPVGAPYCRVCHSLKVRLTMPCDYIWSVGEKKWVFNESLVEKGGYTCDSCGTTDMPQKTKFPFSGSQKSINTYSLEEALDEVKEAELAKKTGYEVHVNDDTTATDLIIHIDKKDRKFSHRLIRSLVEESQYNWLDCHVFVMHYPEKGRFLIKNSGRHNLGTYG